MRDRRGGFTQTDPQPVEQPGRVPGKRTLTAQLSAPPSTEGAAKDEVAEAKSDAKAEVKPDAKAEVTDGKGETDGAKKSADKSTDAKAERAKTDAKTDEANKTDEAGSETEGEAKGDDAKAEASTDSPSELAEAEAWLAEAQTAFASMPTPEIHVCGAACAHMQLARMMDAYAGGDEVFVPNKSQIDSAARKFREKQKAKAPAPEAQKQAAPEGGDGGGGGGEGGEHAGGPEGAGPQGAAPEGGGPEGGDGGGPEAAAPEGGEAEMYGFSGTPTASKPSGFPRILGLTNLSTRGFTAPKLEIKTTQASGSWNAEVQQTTSAEGTSTAVAVPAGRYPTRRTLPYDYTNERGRTIRYNFRVTVEVSPEAHAQVVAAEQEHVDDVSEAYNITYKAVADAINGAVGQSFSGASKAAAIKQAKDSVNASLDPKLHNPSSWARMIQRCANMSRTARDPTDWHTFRTEPNGDDDWDFDAKKVTAYVQDNPNIGVHPSSEVIHL
jgi:hypothetical protein